MVILVCGQWTPPWQVIFHLKREDKKCLGNKAEGAIEISLDDILKHLKF